MKLLHEIEVDRDWVKIEGAMIHRPPYIGRSDWTDFWEQVREMNEEQ